MSFDFFTSNIEIKTGQNIRLPLVRHCSWTHLSVNGVDLLESGKDKHSCLTHTRLSLAKNIHAKHSLGNALVLDCTGEKRIKLEVVEYQRLLITFNIFRITFMFEPE